MAKKRLLLLVLVAVAFVLVSTGYIVSANGDVEASAAEYDVDSEVCGDFTDEDIDRLCNENYITPTIVYATLELGYDVDVEQYINELSAYANAEGTDEEVSIDEAISSVLDCSIDEAMEIIELSDELQGNM